MTKNNVTRLLDQRKIPYQVFELPQQKVGALEAAELLSIPPEQVYKSIVVQRVSKGKKILAVVPGTRTLNLKALAKEIGEKKVKLPTEREAEKLTGLQAGGISPLALVNRGFQVVIDESAHSFDLIVISGGQRGLNIGLSPDHLAMLTKATFAPVSS